MYRSHFTKQLRGGAWGQGGSAPPRLRRRQRGLQARPAAREGRGGLLGGAGGLPGGGPGQGRPLGEQGRPVMRLDFGRGLRKGRDWVLSVWVKAFAWCARDGIESIFAIRKGRAGGRSWRPVVSASIRSFSDGKGKKKRASVVHFVSSVSCKKSLSGGFNSSHVSLPYSHTITQQ